MTDTRDTHDSTQRELLIEHLFVGELMKAMWRGGFSNIEVSKPQADNSGYDLVLETGKVIRHVQLKSSHRLAKTANQKVHVALESKPSGCVIWVRFDAQTLELGPFLWFGGRPRHQFATALILPRRETHQRRLYRFQSGPPQPSRGCQVTFHRATLHRGTH